MKSPTVLISGAGIAGTSLAYWLHRLGFEPTVVERAPALRDGGYKVDIRGAAIDVVKRMGLLDEALRASTDIRGTSFVNSAGKRLATMDADLFGGRSGGDLELLRGDLARILAAATRPAVEYLFGDSISTITQDTRGAAVTFTRGRPRRFDLVVGADGLHSRVRALAFGPEAAFIRHLGHAIAIFSVPNHLGLDRWELLYAAPGKTVGLSSTRRSPDAKAMFIFAAPPLDDGGRGRQQLLAETFAGAGWEVPWLLSQMPAAPDFYLDAISQVQMEHWSSGRVALVGDAAYCPSPASGQGTSIALVGAYVLAGELAASGGDYPTAFSRYEHALREYVAQNQRLALENLKGMVLRSRAQIWFQLGMIRLLPHLPGKEHIIGRVTEAIHSAATGITLKEYAQGQNRLDRYDGNHTYSGAGQP
jgi:2-polyprenyl-6-methoxyphenol hydroxylase-like FAD-dependent oxidoreductase